MRVVVVWALSIVVLGWVDRDDSFYGKIFDVSYSTFLISYETRHRFTIWFRVFDYMAKKIH